MHDTNAWVENIFVTFFHCCSFSLLQLLRYIERMKYFWYIERLQLPRYIENYKISISSIYQINGIIFIYCRNDILSIYEKSKRMASKYRKDALSSSGVASSISGLGTYSIFVFCINFLWNWLFLRYVNTNIWICPPPSPTHLSSWLHHCCLRHAKKTMFEISNLWAKLSGIRHSKTTKAGHNSALLTYRLGGLPPPLPLTGPSSWRLCPPPPVRSLRTTCSWW